MYPKITNFPTKKKTLPAPHPTPPLPPLSIVSILLVSDSSQEQYPQPPQRLSIFLYLHIKSFLCASLEFNLIGSLSKHRYLVIIHNFGNKNSFNVKKIISLKVKYLEIQTNKKTFDIFEQTSHKQHTANPNQRYQYLQQCFFSP